MINHHQDKRFFDEITKGPKKSKPHTLKIFTSMFGFKEIFMPFSNNWFMTISIQGWPINNALNNLDGYTYTTMMVMYGKLQE